MKTKQHHYIVKVGEDIVLNSSLQKDFDGFISPESATTCGIAKAVENRLGMYEVLAITINSEQSDDGVRAHEVMRKFVADYIKSNAFDEVFDKAFQIGIEQGTDAYDNAIGIILQILEIPEIRAFEALQAQGINIQSVKLPALGE